MEQIPVRAGQLHTVKTGLLGTDSCINETLLFDFDLLHGHRMSWLSAGQCRDFARSPGSSGGCGSTFRAVVMELNKDTAVMCVNSLGEKHPVGPIAVSSQAELVVPEGIIDVINGCSFDNNEADAAFGTFFIIGDRTRAGMCIVFAIQHLHRRHDSPVFNAQRAYISRCKQFWINHNTSFQHKPRRASRSISFRSSRLMVRSASVSRSISSGCVK